MESVMLLMFCAIVALILLLSIGVCRESERVAVNTPRRFLRLVGPGLFLRFPMQTGPYEYTRVRIGDRGRYIGNGWGKLGGQNIPVRPVGGLDVDQNFSVKDFVNQEIFVEAQSESAEEQVKSERR